jgi:hypothetical protein
LRSFYAHNDAQGNRVEMPRAGRRGRLNRINLGSAAQIRAYIQALAHQMHIEMDLNAAAEAAAEGENHFLDIMNQWDDDVNDAQSDAGSDYFYAI